MTRTKTAIIAKRADRPPVDTDEIEGLVQAAGFEVHAIYTQIRPEDPGLHLGRGKVETLIDEADRFDVDCIVIDGELTSGQAKNLRQELPAGTQLLDRYRLILDIFAEQATDARAQKQVELASLKYELDWFNEVSDESKLTKYGEKGSRRYQLQDRITALESELNALPDPGERFRRQRREQGFDLVTIAGYTNAGKSTLLHRLADELSLETATPGHPDQATSAAIEDRLFKTLETTTRRATIDGRPILCTDTVGYVSDLPHDLVVSFAETLSEADAADVVLLVTEATDPPERFADKCEVSLDVLTAQDVETDQILPVLNKIDLVDDTTVEDRLQRLTHLDADPIPISAIEGTNLETLQDRLIDELPSAEATIELPYGDAAMSFVSNIHEQASVDAVDYAEDGITLNARGRPSTIEELTNRAERVGGQHR